MPDRNIGVGRNCIQSKGLEVVVFYIGDRIRQMHQVAVRELLKIRGIPKIAEENKSFPYIVLSPQCPSHYIWPFVFDGIMAILDEIIERYPVDPKRIFVTGLSMGGYATWDLAMEYPEKFAGIVPVCGSTSKERINHLKNVPVWAFHGALDEVVPLEEVEELITALKLCGGEGKLTVFPEGKHDIWEDAYQDSELFNHFFQKTLR